MDGKKVVQYLNDSMAKLAKDEGVDFELRDITQLPGLYLVSYTIGNQHFGVQISDWKVRHGHVASENQQD